MLSSTSSPPRRRRFERAAKPSQGPPDESCSAPLPVAPALPVWSAGATESGTAKDPITWLFDPETFAPMAKLVGDARYAIITDHLGTPAAMYDAAGAEVWSATIDAYGDLRNLTGHREACPFRWPGQYDDAETGLYYNRFRYYDPAAGAYVSQDLKRLRGGHRLHAYPTDPLTWVDPFALEGCGTEEEGDLALVRRGESKESATRLEKQAAAAEAAGNARNGVPYGHGVSVTTPESNARLARDPSDSVSTTKKALEDAGFEVRHTPTNADPNHHTVQLPKPVTKDVADRFNAIFGRND